MICAASETQVSHLFTHLNSHTNEEKKCETSFPGVLARTLHCLYFESVLATDTAKGDVTPNM